MAGGKTINAFSTVLSEDTDNLLVQKADNTTGKVSKADFLSAVSGGLATRTLSHNEQVSGVDSLVQVGQFAFDPGEYGVGKSFQFEVVLSVNDVARTATASLYNLTDAEVVTGTTLTAVGLTTPTKVNSGNLTVGAAAGNLKDTEKVYEVRLENDGTLDTELSLLGSAIMRVL